MEQLKSFLLNVRGDIFKILPMKEAEINGANNHLEEYIESLIINLTGATKTFPDLALQKQFLYVLNNLQYLNSHIDDFKRWRKIILNSTKSIDNLCSLFGGEKNDK